MPYTLRSVMQRNKQHYIKPDGSVDPHWADEGSAWAIQEYYGSKGSLLDFTEDDFAAANEEGWSRCLVEDLCEEDNE